jgi:endonuclease/exonuclease/phosphatase family metal-dependent hydrolase
MRVMTWNLWWRFGNWRERQPAILEQLRREEPDLLGLQEVWSDPETNQASWLAKELGMHYVFGAPSDQRRWRDRVNDESAGFGVAILSRWPIRDEQVFDLPEDSSRPLLSVTIDAPHATIPFLTTHLSAMPFGNSARRLVQLEFIARHTAALPVTDHPPVVVGDFNAEPDSDELRRFGGHLTAPIVVNQVFLDAWRYADRHDPGHTWDRANPYVAGWVEPSSRIDYIHVVARSKGPGHILSARRTATAPIDGVWPSDHAAVIAELSE